MVNKYESKAVSFTENEKTQRYYICDRCGKWHEELYGVYIDWDIPNSAGIAKIKLCKKCAKRINRALRAAIEIISYRNPQKDKSVLGKRCEKQYNEDLDLLNFFRYGPSDEDLVLLKFQMAGDDNGRKKV